MIDKTTLILGKDCWTTPRSSPPPCHVGVLEDDKDYDGGGGDCDDDDNHIQKESQAKSSPLHCLDNPNHHFRHISITRGGRN